MCGVRGLCVLGGLCVRMCAVCVVCVAVYVLWVVWVFVLCDGHGHVSPVALLPHAPGCGPKLTPGINLGSPTVKHLLHP